MPRPPSIQWYYKQWLGDNKVLAMEWDAYGMHFHLLMMSIQEVPAGSIPDDVALIRRWLRLPSGQSDSDRAWARVQPQIFAAWALRDGRWFNTGMTEACERRDTYRSRYEIGTKTEPNQNEKEGRLYVDVKELGSGVVSKTSNTDLEAIYKCYPRKVGKGDAFKAISKAFQRLVSGEDPVDGLLRSYEDVLAFLAAKVTQFGLSAAGQAGEYTPHPATWFNQKRYLDDVSEWQRKSASDDFEHCERCGGPKWLRSKLTPDAIRECDCKGVVV